MKFDSIIHCHCLEIQPKNQSGWYPVSVVRMMDDTITVDIPKGIRNFLIGDEVECRCSAHSKVYCFEGEIVDIVFKHPQGLTIYVPGRIREISDAQRENKYKVNFLAEILGRQNLYASVRDISKNGLRIRTSGVFFKGDALRLRLFYDNGDKQLTIQGRVIRESVKERYNEYGISISHIDEPDREKYLEIINEFEQGSK